MSSAPQFHIPESNSTVSVRIIDSTSHIILTNTFIDKPIPGDELLDCPAFSFLMEHPNGQSLLFDLGLRKDFGNLAPAIASRLGSDPKSKIEVEKNVIDVLQEHGVAGEDINAIIMSHWHIDHMGDPSTFPASTALVVGPGFKDALLPGYPANPDSQILQSDYEGRELKELDFNTSGSLKIGQFDAIDYFGDGSFYVLDAPGHTVGHLCGLARVTSSPPSFIFMGADSYHHSGEARPSKWRPLPDSISPNPLDTRSSMPCPGEIFQHLLKNGDLTVPFYGQRKPAVLPFCEVEVAEKTIEKVQEADGMGDIMVVIAHDPHLKGTVPFFPENVNNFLQAGWADQIRWSFLKDFRFALKSNH